MRLIIVFFLFILIGSAKAEHQCPLKKCVEYSTDEIDFWDASLMFKIAASHLENQEILLTQAGLARFLRVKLSSENYCDLSVKVTNFGHHFEMIFNLADMELDYRGAEKKYTFECQNFSSCIDTIVYSQRDNLETTRFTAQKFITFSFSDAKTMELVNMIFQILKPDCGS